MSRKCEICMHRSIIYNVCRIGGSWVDLPTEGKCDDWKPHKNVEIGMEIERAHCLGIVEKVCAADSDLIADRSRVNAKSRANRG